MKARHEFPDDDLYSDYLRHYYAGLAMNGILSNPQLDIETTPVETIAQDAVMFADALIEQLSKQ